MATTTCDVCDQDVPVTTVGVYDDDVEKLVRQRQVQAHEGADQPVCPGSLVELT